MSKATVDKKGDKTNQEQIVAGFNALRADQRNIAQKLAELESELKEHTIVINTLKDVDPERKCFRMVGGVLVERQVKTVLPALQHNEEQVTKLLEGLRKQFEDKGNELLAYKDKHNIRFMGEKDTGEITKESGSSKKEGASTGVLVS